MIKTNDLVSFLVKEDQVDIEDLSNLIENLENQSATRLLNQMSFLTALGGFCMLLIALVSKADIVYLYFYYITIP